MDIPNIPGFTLQTLYNKGIKTVTWTAFQTSLDRRVCIHLLRPEYAADPRECDHFLAIARALARNNATAFPAVYDVVPAPPPPYVLLEFVNDNDLHALIQANGPMATRDILALTKTIAESLSALWQNARFVHRNLKPRNIRLNELRQPHITTFDVAIFADGTDAPLALDEGMVIGTPNYISPEQATSSPTIDCRADIYSLGGTLYYLATGLEPFAELAPEAVLHAQLHEQLLCPPGIPPPLAMLIARMMMKDPAHRYRDWGHLLQDLHNLINQQPCEPLPPGAESTLSIPDPLPNAAAQSAPAPRRPWPRSGGPSVFDEPRRSRFGWLRGLLWVALSAWFFLLANDRMNDPLGLNLPMPNLIDKVRAWLGKPSATQPDPGTPGETNTPPVEAGTPGNGVDPAPPHTPAEPGQATPEPSPAPEEPAPPFSPQRLADLAAVFTANDPVAQERLLSTPDPGGTTFRREQALALLRDLPSEHSLLVNGILTQKDRTIPLLHRGTQRQVKIIGIENGNTLIVNHLDDGRRITIPLDKLDPAQKTRFLRTMENTSPAANIRLALHALSTGDKTYLSHIAPRCGALAPVFEHIVETIP